LVIGPILAGYSVMESIIGLCVVALLKYLYLLAFLLRHAIAKLDYTFIKEHIVLAYPLILAALVGGASEYTDGIIITHYFDKSSLAIYRYGAKELPLTLLMANALSNAMVPIVASTNNLNESIAKIRKQASRFIHFMFPVSIVLMLCSGWLYVHFFNKQFIGSAAVFNMYLLLILSRCLFPQTVLMGLKQNKLLLGVAIVEIILNVVLSVILCKNLGIIGVALGTVIAATCEKLLLLSICKGRFGILPNQLVNTRTYLIYSCILIAIYFCSI
jgi:O-antigen/teichoic acid export membrane protein